MVESYDGTIMENCGWELFAVLLGFPAINRTISVAKPIFHQPFATKIFYLSFSRKITQ